MSETDCISTVSDPSELSLSVTSSRSNQVFAHGATCLVFQCQLAVELGRDIAKEGLDRSERVGRVFSQDEDEVQGGGVWSSETREVARNFVCSPDKRDALVNYFLFDNIIQP
jgi:hypothetical protein